MNANNNNNKTTTSTSSNTPNNPQATNTSTNTTRSVNSSPGGPNAVSPQKLAANCLNAQKSTGPRTALGKSVVRQNALKHGTLARTLVVRGGAGAECGRDFKNLCREMYQQLVPIGPVESALVDQIISATWRLRRARRAESGDIALSIGKLNDTEKAGQFETSFFRALQDPAVLDIAEFLKKTAIGCLHLIKELENLLEAVEESSELTEDALETFKNALCQKSGVLGLRLQEFRAEYLANPENLTPSALKAKHLASVTQYLENEIEECDRHFAALQDAEQIEGDARKDEACLPSPRNFDRILRYEAALERQLYRALAALKSLQQPRLQQEN